MNRLSRILLLVSFFLGTAAQAQAAKIYHAQGEMAGEVTDSSAILQSRLTATDRLVDGDVPGAAGVAVFEWADNEQFKNSKKTDELQASAERDFIVQTKITGLKPDTRVFYRLLYGADSKSLQSGQPCSFRTLPGKTGRSEVSFVVVTGMNYGYFHGGQPKGSKRSYQGPDKALGFPALKSILKLQPDFFVGTGDNIYYDSPRSDTAKTQAELRRKWHEQFVQPRFVDLFRRVPTYWEKDDHDHRYNDNDNSGDRAPSSELGIRTFTEQLPIVDPAEKNPKTYRTHRVSRDLQIWLVEGRDYRSPNKMLDGPNKTLWGKEQIAWLKRTLSESDAAFKLLISPTPMVGPDDAYKIDNHTNHQGFRNEGRAFFSWIKEAGLDKQNFYVLCGDRHWQYHSVDPMGIEEFSSGALVDANSRLGRKPGDPKSTDPKAEIKQIYTQAKPSGGFLHVTVTPGKQTSSATATFRFFDENGVKLYEHMKQATAP